jgi:curved DNA-binding protein CbpA
MATGQGQEEQVDLDEDRRRFILDVYSKLGSMTHYDLLGIGVDADKRALKRAYFELARTMHPDRYFGKNLGTYRVKMEAIFGRITEAYETLSNAEKRAAYDGAGGGAARTMSGQQRAVDPKIAAQRQAAMDLLKQRFADSRAKANEHAGAAARARAAGDIVAALASFKTALSFAPGDAKLEAAYLELQREAAGRLVDSHRKKAVLEERCGRWGDAADSWRSVLEARPDDLEARTRLSDAVAKAGQRS